MSARFALIAAATLTLIAVPVAAQPGSAQDPIVVHMKRGTDTITMTGELRQNLDCCTYLLKARAGQTLHWQVTGAAVRATVTYPDGHGDGPFADTIPLPADGVYLFSISPDLMADGAFGRFKLTLIIPPLPQ
jgi:hypothetical protein